MKKPDEIKKGLECSDCRNCPYKDCDSYEECTAAMAADALAYIQQLEAENTRRHEKIMELYNTNENLLGIVQTIAEDSKATFQQLETKCHQLERERDAAVDDLRMGVCCGTCIYDDTDATEPPCVTCEQDYSFGNWEWRGVKEVSNENTP